MEKEVEEEKNPKMHMLISTTPDWLDLPEPIATNIILEHLDIVDYIRFSAVCKKWLSIQKEHRIRYAPHPPPSPIHFPWLRCNSCIHNNTNDDLTIYFYLPDKQKSHNIPIPISTNKVYELAYGYSWLLFEPKFNGFHKSLCLLNPITGVHFELPLLKPTHTSLMSLPPTNPDCTIMIMDIDHNVYFHRPNDNSGLIKANYSINTMAAAPFIFHNKIYYLNGFEKICIVDVLLPNPVEQMVEMDCSEICVDMRTADLFTLADFLGEIVVIILVYEESSFSMVDYDITKELFVYRADFTTSKWVRMETLDDHVLFFSVDAVFSLPAIDLGCKKNNIYLPGGSNGHGVAWRAFDVSTKDWTDGPRMSVSFDMRHSYGESWSWFLPTLDYYNVAKANGV